MNLFDRMGGDGHEQVVFGHDPAVGLRAIVAVHSTRLGPALGGTRFQPYPTEEDALEDVLRLSRAMTYKAAVAGLDLGGGKAVILGHPSRERTEALIRSYGRLVHSLGGRYLTAEDVGTTQADMDLIRQETPYVTGASPRLGGAGDPSPATAVGVVWAMRAVAAHLWGTTSLRGRRVAVAGVGKVGSALVSHLVEEEASVWVADIDDSAVRRVAARAPVEVVPVDKVHAVSSDFYAPCALGGSLDPVTIPELGCRAVVGAANNQLATPDCAHLLEEAGVLYAPDYVVNAGGLVDLAQERSALGYHPRRAAARVARIFDTTSSVLAAAEAQGITTVEAATRLAEARLAAAAPKPGGRGQ